MRNNFRGWYFRCQSDSQTLAVIPSVHRTQQETFCTIQLITDTQSFHVKLPDSDFQMQAEQIWMTGSLFHKEGFTLDLHVSDLQATGSVRFGPFTPIRYDIMGPFRYVPFLQCRHSVFSMHHRVNGLVLVNGVPYEFQNGTGYLEGDRGTSFPSGYIWTQCFFPEGSLMLSIAEIPLGGLRFTGVIGVILLGEKEYRLATYLGAKAVKIQPGEIVVRQGPFTLTVNPRGQAGHPLRAPVSGDMVRTIREQISCQVSYRFEEKGIPLLTLDAPNAALEYEYGGKV